jgi:hypothetical protein
MRPFVCKAGSRSVQSRFWFVSLDSNPAMVILSSTSPRRRSSNTDEISVSLLGDKLALAGPSVATLKVNLFLAEACIFRLAAPQHGNF